MNYEITLMVFENEGEHLYHVFQQVNDDEPEVLVDGVADTAELALERGKRALSQLL